MRHDWPVSYRSQPWLAFRWLECWRIQLQRKGPFTWNDAKVMPEDMRVFAREGLLRHATQGYLASKKVTRPESILRAFSDLLSNGALEVRGEDGELAVVEGRSDTREVTAIMEATVRTGWMVRSGKEYYWFNVDRVPELGGQLNHFVRIEYPQIRARARRARAAAAEAAQRARQEAQRRLQEERAREEAREAREADDRRIWNHGNLWEIKKRFKITDELLEHLLRRGFTHRQLTHVLHVGGSRLTRIRRMVAKRAGHTKPE
jgi:hypothetical protein